MRWERRERGRQGILPERRIEENHIEALACVRQVLERVSRHDLDLVRGERHAARSQACGEKRCTSCRRATSSACVAGSTGC